MHKIQSLSLRKKCPYSELFWPAFSRIRTEDGEIRNINVVKDFTTNFDSI